MGEPAAPGSAFSLVLLGQPHLCGTDQQVHVLERNDAALFALLVFEGPTSRVRAAQLIWPDVQRADAARNLRQRLFRLRRRTGADPIQGESTLTLAAGLGHDLADLPGQINASAQAASAELLGTLDFSDASGALADWVSALRARWRLQLIQCLTDTAEACEAQGRLAQALVYAERLVADDPTAEHAHRRVMRLHYRRGDRAAALAAFDRCRAVLHRELGEAPGDETLTLAQTVARGGSSDTAIAAPMVVLMRPPLMVGRATPLAWAEQAWQRGVTVVLAGEPGIGKSRFMQALSSAQPGRSIVVARAGDDHNHYQLLRTLVRAALAWPGIAPRLPDASGELRRILPELGDPPAGDLVPTALVDATLAVLRRAADAGLKAVLVDDLQFADAASIDAVLHLATAPGLPLHWLLAHRAGEAPAALTRWRNAPAGETAFELVLPPLDEAAVAELVDSLALPGVTADVWAAALWQHAGGSPMLTLETLRAGLPQLSTTPAAADQAPEHTVAHLGLPEHVGQLIERRLGRLPGSALTLARLAALTGVDFSVALASSLLQRPALDLVEDWRTLEGAQVLRGPAFAHDLVREAVLRTVPKAIAIELHRQIAPAAAALGAPAARVAAHWEQAADWLHAGQAFDDAADIARRAGLRSSELALADRAAACWRRLASTAREFASACRAARAALAVSTADDVAARLVVLQPLATDPVQVAECLVLQATLTVSQGRPADAVAPARVALDRLRAPGVAPVNDRLRQRLQLEAVALLGAGLASAGRGDEAIAVFEPLRAAIAAEPDLALRASVLSAHGFALAMIGRWADAVPLWHESAAAATAAGQVTDAMTDLANIAGALAHRGDAAGAFEASQRALTLGTSRGGASGSLLTIARQTFGMLAISLGRYADAEQVLQQALQQVLAEGNNAGRLRTTLANHLANVYLHLGQYARAQQSLRLVPDDEPKVWRQALLQARLARDLGQPALPLLRESLRRWQPHDQPLTRLGIELELTTELPAAEALPLCQAALAAAQAGGLHAVHLLAQLRLAQVQVRRGGLADAAALAHTVMQRAGSVAPYDLYRGAFWWQLADVFAATGQPEAQTLALARGVQWMQDALPHIPAAYRESFLERQPANRALRAALRI